ncbi:Rho GTPase activating protein 5 isoform 2 [Xenopus laevis]|nr:Rho GTPase activating protein 5 isoform 2 [Xenopus laevis]AAI33757.1 Unknown (protein for MGC:161004) [Xenopus laevis]
MEVTVNAVAGALKAFFADLPAPLIPYNLHLDLLDASKVPEKMERLKVLKDILRSFPPVNYDVLKFIIAHLNRVSQHSKTNLMTADNLSICFWPTLMRPDFESKEFFSTTKNHQSVIETFIVQCQFFFYEGDIVDSPSATSSPSAQHSSPGPLAAPLVPLQLPPPLQPQLLQPNLQADAMGIL